jgi:hypothetical protein
MPVASRRSLLAFQCAPCITAANRGQETRSLSFRWNATALPSIADCGTEDPANPGHILGIPGTCFGSFLLVRAGYEAEGQLGSGRPDPSSPWKSWRGGLSGRDPSGIGLDLQLEGGYERAEVRA